MCSAVKASLDPLNVMVSTSIHSQRTEDRKPRSHVVCRRQQSFVAGLVEVS